MKKAVNIYELANNYNTANLALTKEDENVYVPIFDEKIANLRNQILYDTSIDYQTFFVAGQSGTGKTTALNFLPNDAILTEYEIVHFTSSDLLDLNDVDIIDVLLMIGFALMEATESDELKIRYVEKLQELAKIHREELEISKEHHTKHKLEGGASVQGTTPNFIKWLANFKIQFFANYRGQKEYRKATREFFRLKKQVLLDFINRIVTDFLSAMNGNKKLLLLIDDLDKVGNPNQIKNLFIENRRFLENIHCKKIVAIPIILPTFSAFVRTNTEITFFILNVKANPIDKSIDKVSEQQKIKDTHNRLEQVARIRIAEEHQYLLDDNALIEAIQQSGGILRQFLDILYGAAIRVRRLENKTHISLEDVKSGTARVQTRMSWPVAYDPNKIELLNSILQYKHLTKKSTIRGSEPTNLLAEALNTNQIIAYQNGSIWYEVNPLLVKIVKNYTDTI